MRKSESKLQMQRLPSNHSTSSFPYHKQPTHPHHYQCSNGVSTYLCIASCEIHLLTACSTAMTPAQPISPLLRLPPELRNKIYLHIFSAQYISVSYLDFVPRRLAAVAAASAPSICSGLSRSCFARLMAPTRVCRQIRAETRLLPYGYSSYKTSYPLTFGRWMQCLDGDIQRVVWERLDR